MTVPDRLGSIRSPAPRDAAWQLSETDCLCDQKTSHWSHCWRRKNDSTAEPAGLGSRIFCKRNRIERHSLAIVGCVNGHPVFEQFCHKWGGSHETNTTTPQFFEELDTRGIGEGNVA
jgi:hypothetical protein